MFYCNLFENLEDIDANKQPMIVTLSRELCQLLVGNDPLSFTETLQGNKTARRNMMRFMMKTGH